MYAPISIFKNPVLAKHFFANIAQFGKPILEIDGYNEYATSTKDLDPEDQKKIKKLAQDIVASHKTDSPVVSFVIHGHADVALREIPANRQKVEQEKSEERAHSVRNLILQEIMAIEPTGKLIAATIHFDSVGMGSKFRKVVNPVNEQQMKKNRRIEVFTAAAFRQLPIPKPPPAPRPPEIGTHWKIQIKVGSVTTVTPPGEFIDMFTFVTLLLELEIIDVDRKLKASFSAKTLGLSLLQLTVGPPLPVQSTQVTEGTPVNFSTTKGVELKDFAGKVLIAQDFGGGVSNQSFMGDFIFSFEEMATTKAVLTRPGVVSVNAGQGIATFPSIGLGAGSSGSMSMKGNIIPVN